jgi:DNA-directed RNA polymerase subunit RPC12/RpoP
MARVVQRPKTPKTKEFCRMKHKGNSIQPCGATVEFSRTDIVQDQRDGNYVVCPYCKHGIAEKLLNWRWE